MHFEVYLFPLFFKLLPDGQNWKSLIVACVGSGYPGILWESRRLLAWKE
jgi:hypothetical protein